MLPKSDRPLLLSQSLVAPRVVRTRMIMMTPSPQPGPHCQAGPACSARGRADAAGPAGSRSLGPWGWTEDSDQTKSGMLAALPDVASELSLPYSPCPGFGQLSVGGNGRMHFRWGTGACAD
jgi:hypothetical protein